MYTHTHTHADWLPQEMHESKLIWKGNKVGTVFCVAVRVAMRVAGCCNLLQHVAFGCTVFWKKEKVGTELRTCLY